MTSSVEARGIPPEAGASLVLSVCRNLVEIDHEIDAARQQRFHRDVSRNLYREKGHNMLLLLTARYDSPIPLAFGLIRYPGERFHPFSQNKIELALPPGIKTGHHSNIRCGVDLIAQGLNEDSQEVIENLLGDPDYFIDEAAQETVDRTYEEIRESQREFRYLSDRGITTTMDYLDRLRLFLAEKILSFRYHPELRRKITLVPFQGQRKRIVKISTSYSNNSGKTRPSAK
ncbi:MAG: hypothetical protein HYW63_04265 [Candidatus Levybacteria bacterium]|nr:hypothetical protein [Candidatus Levybacteria bacterium]